MNSLERRVLQLIGEDVSSPDVFADTDAGMAPIRDSINDAIQEIVMLTGGQKRDYFIPLRSEQAYYRFRLNYGYLGWVTDVWLVNQKRRLEQTDLIRLANHDPRWMVTSATPRSYFPLGHELIGLYPKPSSTSDSLEIKFVEIPKAYESDTDRIKLKSDFEDGAVHFAVSEYWASRGDKDEAFKHWGMYLDALGIRNRYTSTPQHAPTLDTNKEVGPVETS